MQFSEEFDLQKQKIAYLEKEVIKLQDENSLIVASVREVQKYLIRLAQNQAVVSEQVAAWPYVTVPAREDTKKVSKQPKKDDKEK
jgi:hypothetical protein